MRTRQGAMSQSLRAVQNFLDEHADKLAGVVQSGARKRLDAAVEALHTHKSDQTGNFITAQSLTQRQRSLRLSLLREHMLAVARIASADLPNTPEFRPLRMPRGRLTPEKLAAAATGMAQVAAKYTDIFVAAGMSPDFVRNLNAAAESMLAALADRTVTNGRRRGATVGLQEKLSEGRKVVAILDVFVKAALKDEPSLIANWNIVARVSNLGRGAIASADASAPPDPSPSATQPAASSPSANAPPAGPKDSPSALLPSQASTDHQ